MNFFARSICAFYSFLTFSFSAWGAIEPGSSKAFAIRYHGHTSYVLGTWRNFDVQKFKIPSEILGALNQVEEVIFEANRFNPMGETTAKPNPELYLDKVFGSPPFELQPRQAAVAKELFINSKLKDIYHQLSPGILHFFAHSFGDQLISHNMMRVARMFASKNEYLSNKYGPIRLKDSHRAAAKQMLGSQFSEKNLFARAFEYFMRKNDFGERKPSFDSEIYRQARRKDLRVLGLEDTEPYRDVLEATLVLVDESDLNRTLIWIEEMIAENKAAQNWSDIIHSNYLIGKLQSEFFKMDNHKFVELANLVSAFTGPIPGEERLKDYEQNRHQYWVPELIRRMKKRPVFIAVGLSHVIGSQNSKNLLDYLREQGAYIEPLVSCEDSLLRVH